MRLFWSCRWYANVLLQLFRCVCNEVLWFVYSLGKLKVEILTLSTAKWHYSRSFVVFLSLSSFSKCRGRFCSRSNNSCLKLFQVNFLRQRFLKVLSLKKFICWYSRHFKFLIHFWRLKPMFNLKFVLLHVFFESRIRHCLSSRSVIFSFFFCLIYTCHLSYSHTAICVTTTNVIKKRRLLLDGLILFALI